MRKRHHLVLVRMAHEMVTFYSDHALIEPSQEVGFFKTILDAFYFKASNIESWERRIFVFSGQVWN